MSRTVENPSAAVAVEFVGTTSADQREYALEKIDLVRQRLYQLLTHQHHHPRHGRPRGAALFGRRKED
jgi:hypothetical protein